MTRNLKALGLALVAALALGAVGAQSASAVVEHSFRSSSQNEKTILTGHIDTSPTVSKHVFKPSPESGLAVECSVATFSHTVEGNIRDTVTAHPTYGSCESSFGAATVDTNGCNYIFDSDTTTSTHSSTDEHATVSIECEAGHHISVTTGLCNLTFSAKESSTPVNQSIHGVRYTQLASHSGKHALTVYATAKTIHFRALGGSLCGFGGLPAGTYNTGTYTGAASVTGYEDTDNSPGGTTTTGTTWKHGAQVDLTISTPT